jgi:hypothetical protein
MADKVRSEFAERVRKQIASRYTDAEISVDSEGFAMRVNAPGIDVSLPLTPLFHECLRNEAETPTLISAFVRDIESSIDPRSESAFSLSGLLWCVRTADYLSDSTRSDELTSKAVAGDLIAFVARQIPVNAMRGVARSEWKGKGVTASEISTAADNNTAERFGSLLDRVRGIDRVPGDGWRISVDELFCGSAILVPEIRWALTEKAQDDVLVAIPDRSVLLVLPASAKAAPRFAFRVTREWREAMNPCSRQVLLCDGESLTATSPKARPRALLDWLSG